MAAPSAFNSLTQSPEESLTFWKESSRHILLPRRSGGRCHRWRGWCRRNFFLARCLNDSERTITEHNADVIKKVNNPALSVHILYSFFSSCGLLSMEICYVHAFVREAAPRMRTSVHRLDVSFHPRISTDLQGSHRNIWGKRNRKLKLTVDGEFDGWTGGAAHRVFHRAAVDVVIRHQHARDGQELLVRGQREPRHVAQWLSAFEPSVCSPGSVVVGTVEEDVFTELQHGWRLHVDIGSGYRLWM